ncbi:MAG: type II toxin-antitoxin system VapC family toxin [Gemmatimonadota bacterium]
MIFVDTNVFMYAVGREHPLRPEAQAFFLSALESGTVLATSAEALQELLHAYLPVGRIGTLDAALALAQGRMAQIWAVEADDVFLARNLMDRYPALGARDLLHLASCLRRKVTEIKTFDRALASAFKPSS